MKQHKKERGNLLLKRPKPDPLLNNIAKNCWPILTKVFFFFSFYKYNKPAYEMNETS